MTESTAVATRAAEPSLTPFEVIERVVGSGDLGKMTAQDRVAFYWRTCESMGLNPMTRPFEFITLNGKLTMYARKDATDQLRKLNGVSVTSIERSKDDELGLLTVTVSGRDKSGREDQATGVVTTKGLSGEALANAVMKAETKAKRRLTLSLVGLGFLDESEIEGATADVDPTTGELVERAKPKSLLESVRAQQDAMAAAPVTEATDGADEAPEVVTGEVVDEAAWTGDGSVVDEAPGLTELTLKAFQALREEHGVSPVVVAKTARDLYPDASGIADLSDHDRATLWLEIEKRQAAG
jgi:hypothetical protein